MSKGDLGGKYVMTRTNILYVMGFAGSGKTTLVTNFSRYLSRQGYNTAVINLDPGVELLPYTPEFDVREIVSLREVMRKENLGPNGGLIRSVEYIVKNKERVIEKIVSISQNVDWLLVDTTGQLELFAFRPLGDIIVRAFMDYPSVGLLLVDITNIQRPSDIVMAQLICMAIQLKLSIDTIIAINKIDLANAEAKKMIEMFYVNPEEFRNIMMEQHTDTFSGMSIDLLDTIRNYMPPARIVLISAKNGEGFDELYDIIHEVFCTCGDLT